MNMWGKIIDFRGYSKTHKLRKDKKLQCVLMRELYFKKVASQVRLLRGEHWERRSVLIILDDLRTYGDILG